MLSVRSIIVASITLVITAAVPAAAQQCLGLSSITRGYFAYGVEGTDGATGDGFTLGLRFGERGVQLQRRTLEPVTLLDDMETVQAVGAAPITKQLPLCVTAGFGWTGYDDDRIQSWGSDPNGGFIQRVTSAGPYRRLQAPVGIAFGKEVRFGSKFAAGGFVNPSLVYEHEKYESSRSEIITRGGVGLGFTAGASLSYNRLMLRSALSSLSAHNYTLNGFHNFPHLSLQLGVRF